MFLGYGFQFFIGVRVLFSPVSFPYFNRWLLKGLNEIPEVTSVTSAALLNRCNSQIKHRFLQFRATPERPSLTHTPSPSSSSSSRRCPCALIKSVACGLGLSLIARTPFLGERRNFAAKCSHTRNINERRESVRSQ